MDPRVSRRVTITRCFIDVGDDNVAVKSGQRIDGREFACENRTITDCAFTSYYPKIPAADAAQPVTRRTPKCRKITSKNLTATSSQSAG